MKNQAATMNMNLQEVANKHGITLQQAQVLKDAMCRTWETIYYDLVECFESERQMYAAYSDEAALVAENTLDADRVTTFCPDMDLKFVYNMPDGKRRISCIEMGEDIWRARR